MIYIQKDDYENIPHHFDCSCAMYGAIESGKDYKLIPFSDIESGKFDSMIKNNLFVGSVEFMREVFSRVDLDIRLPKNSNRESELITLVEAHNRVSNGERIFIKPYDIKLFTGLILDGCTYSCLESLPDDTKVLCYEVFNTHPITEWRCYIRDGEIIDSRNYSGDFKISPNYEYVEKIISENIDDFPKSYTIDVGILEGGENVVIEFNDMWGIGNYGVDNYTYLRLLKSRYFEIMKKKSYPRRDRILPIIDDNNLSPLSD